MSLKNCVVALSGTWGKETHGQIGQSIEKAGGKYSDSLPLAYDVTHLVVSEDHWKKGIKTPKCEDAVRPALAANSQVKVVSIDWIRKSVSSKRKVPEKQYLMHEPDDEEEKYVKAEDDVKDEPVKRKKRGRAAKSKGSKVKKEEEDEDGAEEEGGKAEDEVKDEPAKGKKRGRAAKSKSAKIKEEEDEIEAAAEEPPAKKAKGQEDGQVWKAGMVIPLDEYCQLDPSWHVYVDKNDLIWDANLNQTNTGRNNNKFYKIQLLTGNKGGGYKTWTRWGRVGESGQNAYLGDGSLEDSMKMFEKKFKDKTGHKWADRLAGPKKGRYTFIEKDYGEDSPDDEKGTGKNSRRGSGDAGKGPECTLTLPVQQLMTLIFNTENFASAMAAMNYDAQKMPLGKLSKTTLSRGFETLKKLAEILADKSLAQNLHNVTFEEATEDLSNSYYTLIPHDFGRDRPPIIDNDAMLKAEIQLLESLTEMEISDKIMKEAKADVTELVHPLDRQYQGLGMTEMMDLDPKSSEYKQLREYLVQSTGATHHVNYKVEAIFRIERQGEFDRFSKSPYAKVKSSDRRLLWHGSRATNFGGILSQGLRIAPPEAPVSGYMFGKGIYLADISSKSANYTSYHSSGGVGLLLLCEAELGRPMLELTVADYNAGDVAKKQKSFSTWGKGSTAPKGWKDAGCVNKNLKGISMPDMSKPPGPSGVPGAGLIYNEYICYDVAQIRLRYLFRVKIG